MRALLCWILVMAWNGPPSEPSEAKGNPSEAVIEQAIGLVNSGNVDRGLGMIRELVEREPKNANAKGVLGKILDFDGRPDEAVAIWESALTDTPADVGFLKAIRNKTGSGAFFRIRNNGVWSLFPALVPSARPRSNSLDPPERPRHRPR